MTKKIQEPAVTARSSHVGTVTADDGTELGWLSVGKGPGLVVVHGANAVSMQPT